MDPKQELQELCEALGLQYFEQDWGLINADPNRLREFISYYESRSFTPAQRYDMVDLILASANEGLEAHQLSSADAQDAAEVAARHAPEAPVAVAHWIGSDSGYPIGQFLRERLHLDKLVEVYKHGGAAGPDEELLMYLINVFANECIKANTLSKEEITRLVEFSVQHASKDELNYWILEKGRFPIGQLIQDWFGGTPPWLRK